MRDLKYSQKVGADITILLKDEATNKKEFRKVIPSRDHSYDMKTGTGDQRINNIRRYLNGWAQEIRYQYSDSGVYYRTIQSITVGYMRNGFFEGFAR